MSENAGSSFDFTGRCDMCGSDAIWRSYPTPLNNTDGKPAYQSQVVRCDPCKVLVTEPPPASEPGQQGITAAAVAAARSAAAIGMRWVS